MLLGSSGALEKSHNELMINANWFSRWCFRSSFTLAREQFLFWKISFKRINR